MPDQPTGARGARAREFVVVQEAFAHHRDRAVRRPAAAGHDLGREGRHRHQLRAAHLARARRGARAGRGAADWRIAADVRAPPRSAPAAALAPMARALFALRRRAEAVWNEHREATRGRDLDITGLSYAMLEPHGPQQWPFPEGARAADARLYEDGRFPHARRPRALRRRAPQPLAEARDARLSVRADHRTPARPVARHEPHRHAGRLFGHAAEPASRCTRATSARRSIEAAISCSVTSRRGSIVLPAQPSDAMAPCRRFIAMHWGAEVPRRLQRERTRAGRRQCADHRRLLPAVEQPELKHCAVKLIKAELPWRLLALAWLPTGARARCARRAARR